MKNERMEKKTQILLIKTYVQRFPEYQVPHQAERDFIPSSKYSHTQGTEEG